MMNIITFDEAIKDSKTFTNRHLLLGNGFSIDCNECFKYDSLLKESKFANLQRVQDIFSSLKTCDFEVVINVLTNCSKLIPLYKKNNIQPLIDSLKRDRKNIKNTLIQTLIEHHCTYQTISDDMFNHCRSFLSNFMQENKSNNIFTLNYDLLLYWAYFYNEGKPHIELYNFKDGFSRSNNENLLLRDKNQSQSVFYIHGAIHLTKRKAYLIKRNKLEFNNILEQIKEQCNYGEKLELPLFVLEGSDEEKENTISQNKYLRNSLKNFQNINKQKNACLFIHGSSLQKSDNHIWNLIKDGEIPKLYISVFGDIAKTNLVARAESFKQNRKCKLDISFYNAKSANI